MSEAQRQRIRFLQLPGHKSPPPPTPLDGEFCECGELTILFLVSASPVFLEWPIGDTFVMVKKKLTSDNFSWKLTIPVNARVLEYPSVAPPAYHPADHW